MRWLIIFDNVEDPELLRPYWPTGQGHSLVTTRNHLLAFHPADSGLEVQPFSSQEGAEFLSHLLSRDVDYSTSNDDLTSAIQLSNTLGGHAFAISQIAGLIHRRAWSITEFLRIYKRNSYKMLQHGTLDALWRLPFRSLSGSASSILGIICLLNPDAIPQELFEPTDSTHLLESLGFARDELEYVCILLFTFFTHFKADLLRFSEALESLLSLALIKRDIRTRAISIHSLVQTEYKKFQGEIEYQEAFNNATALLSLAFPSKKRDSDQMYSVWDQCQKYIANVLSLLGNYKEHPLKPTADFYNLLTACAQ
jgi:hypothetical protein